MGRRLAGGVLAGGVIAAFFFAHVPQLMAQGYSFRRRGFSIQREGRQGRRPTDRPYRRGGRYRTPRNGYDGPHTDFYPPTPFPFGAQSHTGALAGELAQLANGMCLEAHRHYRHNRAFAAIYRDMYGLLTDAKHIAELANSGYQSADGTDHIASDLYDIDRLFHRIQGAVHRWTPDNPRHHTLPGRMAAVGETIHHLIDDYGVKSRVAPTGPPRIPPDRQPSLDIAPDDQPEETLPETRQVPTRAGKSIVIENNFGP